MNPLDATNGNSGFRSMHFKLFVTWFTLNFDRFREGKFTWSFGAEQDRLQFSIEWLVNCKAKWVYSSDETVALFVVKHR